MSLRSPQRSPTDFSRKGFQPLHAMAHEPDIPLTNVHTNASSTGARKQGEGLLNANLNTQPTFRDDEKGGFFNRGAAGRRKVKKHNPKGRKMGTDGEEVRMNKMGRFYNKIVSFSIVTRYMVYVLPVAILLAAPIVAFAVIDPNAVIGGVRAYLLFTWIEVVWLSIWVSKLAATTVPWLFMFLCGVVSPGVRKYAQILKAVEIPLSLVGWAVTSLVTFTALTTAELNRPPNHPGGPDHWTVVMTRILAPLLVSSLLYLGEKMIVQIISVNYHRRSFDGRIQESKHLIHLLGLLYDASRTLFPMYCDEFLDEDYAINDSIEAMLAKTAAKKHARSGSANPLKLIGDVGRLGDKVTSIFGNIASEITGKQILNPTSAHSIVVEALEKTRSSEALAKRLWMSFVVEGKEALSAEDVQEVLGPARRDEADEAFAALDNDGNGDISLDEMIMKVVEIGKDRKAIAASMRDVGQAIGVLDQVLVFVVAVICIFVFVAFQDTNFVTTLATAGTTLLSLSFVFAVTTQEFLGSCIFLFVKHPYDVGDRVDMVGTERECLVVQQISLLFTVFKRIDNMKLVQVPNIVLNTLWIENVTRSKAMKEQLDMFISFDTSLEDIDILRSEMEKFVRHPDNSRDFQPDIILEATGIGNMDKLQLKIEIRHKSNWHNETVRAARRSKFMCALVLALRKVPIYAPGGGGDPLGGPSNPGYSVAIDDTWAAEAREKAKKDKDAKRLIPTASAENPAASSSEALGPMPEEKAAEALNSRRPTLDQAARGSDFESETLASNESLHKQRSNEIDYLSEGLVKRASTRGKRRAGETVPEYSVGDGPSVSVTQPSPRVEPFVSQPISTVIDEEAELGSNAPYYGGYSFGVGQGQGMGIAMGSPSQPSNNPYTLYPPQQPQFAKQSAPPGTQIPVIGAQGRLRRLSVGGRSGNNSSSTTVVGDSPTIGSMGGLSTGGGSGAGGGPGGGARTS
ncbi:hypothetical protein B7494_g1339 [Chlorociboria aeruginascens]|nr:hypothetical protein B7494_g1339 [Chlorociboria aeruginascens]